MTGAAPPIGNDVAAAERRLARIPYLVCVTPDTFGKFAAWLADVLFRLDTTPAARVAELLPHEWQKHRQAESAGDTAQRDDRQDQTLMLRLHVRFLRSASLRFSAFTIARQLVHKTPPVNSAVRI